MPRVLKHQLQLHTLLREVAGLDSGKPVAGNRPVNTKSKELFRLTRRTCNRLRATLTHRDAQRRSPEYGDSDATSHVRRRGESHIGAPQPQTPSLRGSMIGESRIKGNVGAGLSSSPGVEPSTRAAKDPLGHIPRGGALPSAS